MILKIFKINLVIAGLVFSIWLASCKDDEAVPAPRILSFTPSKGLSGTIVTISGENFGAMVVDNKVNFSGIAAAISEASTTSIKVVVPEGATSGKIEVVANSLKGISGTDFIVPPTFTDFSPKSGMAGTQVIITGTGFSTTMGSNVVTIDNKSMTVVAATATSITANIPNNATTGKLSVIIGTETVTSLDDFVLVPKVDGNAPSVGPVNMVVTINGSGFGTPYNTNLVKFGGVEAVVLSGTANSLTVKVPEGAVSGPISLTTGNHTSQGGYFDVIIEAARAGESGFDSGFSVVVDAGGNTYVTGSFQNSISFGSKVLTGQGEEIFVVKYNSDCEVVWAVSAGGAGSDQGISMAVDTNGNTYIAGSISANATFGSLTVNSNGGYDGYAAKLNSSGTFVWARAFGGTDTDNALSISQREGNVVVTGAFKNTLSLDGLSITSAGADDAYITKLNADNGKVTWLKGFGTSDDSSGRAVKIAADNSIYLSGLFFGNYTMGTSNFTSHGGLDAFLAKLTADGVLLWVKQFGGSDWDAINAVVTDASGNAYTTGYFGSTITIDGVSLIGPALENIFIVKFGSNGSVIWAKYAGGNNPDYGKEIDIDNSGNVYITGYFSNEAYFGTLQISSTPLMNNDIFVAKYSNEGNPLWVRKAGGGQNDFGNGIAIGTDGIIHVTGSYRNDTSTFNITELNNKGGDDFFLWKIRQ